MPGALRGQNTFRFPGTEVTDGFELPCRCWEPDLGPLQEQQLFLTSETSFQFSALQFETRGGPMWQDPAHFSLSILRFFQKCLYLSKLNPRLAWRLSKYSTTEIYPALSWHFLGRTITQEHGQDRVVL